jgi:uncharacterized membrane protein
VTKSKAVATWAALIGGAFGLHRFYLHGPRDPWGWLFPLPTLLGLHGVWRMREYGQDDRLAWILLPVLGLVLAVAMLSAIVYGLTPDEKWDARHNRGVASAPAGWGAVLGVIFALMLGAGVLMATIAFSAQRWFESQAAASAPVRETAPG